MKVTAAEMVLKDRVAPSNQSPLLTLASTSYRMQPVLLVFPTGLTCRAESAREVPVSPRCDPGET